MLKKENLKNENVYDEAEELNDFEEPFDPFAGECKKCKHSIPVDDVQIMVELELIQFACVLDKMPLDELKHFLDSFIPASFRLSNSEKRLVNKESTSLLT